MEEIAETERLAEEYRSEAENLITASERMMDEHRALVKKVKTLSSKAGNSSKMRDECSREAMDSENKAESWRTRHDERKGKNALDLTTERNQINMYSQAAKSMRMKEKKAESDRIKFERMIDECNREAHRLKKEAVELKKKSNEMHELYIGQLRKISRLKKE